MASVPLVYAASAVRIERQPSLSSFEFPHFPLQRNLASSPSSFKFPHFPAPSNPNLRAQKQVPIPQTPQFDNASPDPSVPTYQPVMVPVTVLEPLGRYVTGLPSAAFHLLDEGVEQSITAFYSHLPLSLAVVVNTENEGIPDLVPALTKLRQALTPEDELVLVYARGERPTVMSSIGDLPAVAKDIAGDPSKNRSIGIDAAYMALDGLRGARHPRRVLAVIDPIRGDDFSTHTASDVEAIFQQEDIPVYRLLPGDTDHTRQDISAFGLELKYQYILTFTPTHAGFHGIVVRLDPLTGMPSLEAHTRSGYYSRFFAQGN
jgi:hypothetical protein